MTLNLPKRIADNIQNFTGRTWLLDPVINWLEKTEDRFFILTGDMSTGKSMVAAWLAVLPFLT